MTIFLFIVVVEFFVRAAAVAVFSFLLVGYSKNQTLLTYQATGNNTAVVLTSSILFCNPRVEIQMYSMYRSIS